MAPHTSDGEINDIVQDNIEEGNAPIIQDARKEDSDEGTDTESIDDDRRSPTY